MHSIVFDYLRDDEYYATRDEGARLNNNRLRVSTTNSLEEAIAVISDDRQLVPRGSVSRVALANTLASNVHSLRMNGCTGIDIVDVANGKADIWVGNGIESSLLERVSLLITEAGGYFSTASQETKTQTQTLSIAGNPKLHRMTSEVLAKVA